MVNLATPEEKPGINTLALSAVQIEFPSLSAPYPHDGVCLPGYIEPVVVLMNCPSEHVIHVMLVVLVYDARMVNIRALLVVNMADLGISS